MTFPVFVSGEVLKATDMNAIGMWLVKSQTIGTAVSSVTVTNAFTSDYENYRIIVSGGAASTTNQLNLTLGSTLTGYYASGYFIQYSAGGLNAQQQNNSAAWLAGRGTTDGLNSIFELYGPQLAQRTGFQVQMATFSTVAANDYTVNQTGYLNNATQYTAFTLTASSGTLTGGTIYVYGYRK